MMFRDSRSLLKTLLISFAALVATSTAAAQDAPSEPPPEDDIPGWGAPPPEAPVEAPPNPQTPPPAPAPPSTETTCDDRADDDNDGMIDCADADCFGQQVCEAGGNDERTNDACSDWIDNDGDGTVDCDDDDCGRAGITVCQGSDRSNRGAGEGGEDPAMMDELPELGEGMSVEDLIGTNGDIDGERNDYLCADGRDNDGDGRTDCADFGCRFDPAITVCTGTPGLRFSFVGGAGLSFDFENEEPAEAFDASFSRIQIRALGPIPYIPDSFFLLSARLDGTPRLTFATFQIPLGSEGHYAALNSGSGGLSVRPILSASKRPLLEPPSYLLRAFEQGNGVQVEFGGPLVPEGNLLRYRLFGAAGSGTPDGNVGGRFFRGDDRNFTWSAGAQLQINAIGQFDRFDNPFMYDVSAPMLGFMVGAKYDQRARERYPAGHVFGWFRYSVFSLRVESYLKYELEFGGFQAAWTAEVQATLWPKHLSIAADIGQFYATEFDESPVFNSALRRPLDEFQFRVGLHYFWYRNIALLSLVYSQTTIEANPDRPLDVTQEREMRLEAQFRF